MDDHQARIFFSVYLFSIALGKELIFR